MVIHQVIAHQGGSGWSLRVVIHQVIAHQGGFIRVVSQLGGFSSVWSLRMVTYQVISHHGGLIRVVSHLAVSHQSGLSSG